MAAKPEPLGLMACKVVMRARVSSAAKAAGAVLLDHVNWTDFRCDPGIERIVKMAGYSRSNVQAGLQQLADDGIVTIRVHGSRMGRNSYDFCWDEIRRRDAAMQEALKSGSPPTRKQGGGDPESEAQTRVPNPKIEPVGQARKNWEGVAHRLPATQARPPPTARRSEAAETAAVRRWNGDLHKSFGQDPVTYAAIIAAIDAEIRDAATEAEIRKRGSGIATILEQLEDHGLTRGER